MLFLRAAFLVGLCVLLCPAPTRAQEGAAPEPVRKHSMLSALRMKKDTTENAAENSKTGLRILGKGTVRNVAVGKRTFILYLPQTTQPMGKRPLLVVLHGGFGNGEQIRSYLGLEPFADQNGFLIAYMNGTAVTKLLPQKRAGWNAGECCGQPQEKHVDDVGYISDAVQTAIDHYGVDPSHVYGTGHSNGAMMTYRMLCETDLYHGAAIYAGALEIEAQACPLARGKSILAIHGAKDQNLPVQGGHTTKGLNRKTNYRSQDYTINVFKNSGADYSYILLPNADHNPESINAELLATRGKTLPQTIVSFLKLDH